ncbi:MAG: BMC domain-containing protein [Treponema sp.]|jgi:ethanolamine utilization protein EutS|nr:BMC domain-containing protein [Treponema sp.]
MEEIVFQDKQRIIQEFVPGKQVTLAHVIANPDKGLYRKLGAVDIESGALGIMTITPGEGAVIGADMAVKSAEIKLVFVDRFSGSLIFSGDVSNVEAGMRAVLDLLSQTLHFAPAEITKS